MQIVEKFGIDVALATKCTGADKRRTERRLKRKLRGHYLLDFAMEAPWQAPKLLGRHKPEAPATPKVRDDELFGELTAYQVDERNERRELEDAIDCVSDRIDVLRDAAIDGAYELAKAHARLRAAKSTANEAAQLRMELKIDGLKAAIALLKDERREKQLEYERLTLRYRTLLRAAS